MKIFLLLSLMFVTQISFAFDDLATSLARDTDFYISIIFRSFPDGHIPSGSYDRTGSLKVGYLADIKMLADFFDGQAHVAHLKRKGLEDQLPILDEKLNAMNAKWIAKFDDQVVQLIAEQVEKRQGVRENSNIYDLLLARLNQINSCAARLFEIEGLVEVPTAP